MSAEVPDIRSQTNKKINGRESNLLKSFFTHSSDVGSQSSATRSPKRSCGGKQRSRRHFLLKSRRLASEARRRRGNEAGKDSRWRNSRRVFAPESKRSLRKITYSRWWIYLRILIYSFFLISRGKIWNESLQCYDPQRCLARSYLLWEKEQDVYFKSTHSSPCLFGA